MCYQCCNVYEHLVAYVVDALSHHIAPVFVGDLAKIFLVLNINKNPWMSGDYLEQKKEVLSAFLASIDEMHPLLDEKFDDVCFDLGLDPATTSKETVLQHLAGLGLWSRVGHYTAASRFYSFIPGLEEIDTEWTASATVFRFLADQLHTWVIIDCINESTNPASAMTMTS